MIADIIIIVILALSIFLGYKKGLIELGINLCAVVIAIVATLILYRPITNIVINTTNLDENIESAIVGNFTSDENSENLDESIQNQIQSQIQNEILPKTAKELSISIIRTGVMLILYVVIRIALKFVTVLADLVSKLPILDQFNKIGGIIFGAVRGIAVIYIALLLISFIGQVNSQNVIHAEIEKSVITKELYKNNIISLLIK